MSTPPCHHGGQHRSARRSAHHRASSAPRCSSGGISPSAAAVRCCCRPRPSSGCTFLLLHKPGKTQCSVTAGLPSGGDIKQHWRHAQCPRHFSLPGRSTQSRHGENLPRRVPRVRRSFGATTVQRHRRRHHPSSPHRQQRDSAPQVAHVSHRCVGVRSTDPPARHSCVRVHSSWCGLGTDATPTRGQELIRPPPRPVVPAAGARRRRTPEPPPTATSKPRRETRQRDPRNEPNLRASRPPPTAAGLLVNTAGVVRWLGLLLAASPTRSRATPPTGPPDDTRSPTAALNRTSLSTASSPAPSA